MRIVKKVLPLLLMLLSGTVLFAQEGDTEKPARNFPKASLKINPTALVNFFRPSLALGTDIWISEHMSIDVGAGWFFGSALREYKGESMNGYRQRLGFKYIFLPRRRVNPYIGAEGKCNLIYEKSIEQLSRFGGQYEEVKLINRNTQNYGADLRAGAHFFLGEKRRFMIDLYGGFGYRYTKVSMKLPADAELISNELIFALERPVGIYHLPDLIFGFQLGYVFY